MSVAFQVDAFQNDAFQTSAGGGGPIQVLIAGVDRTLQVQAGQLDGGNGLSYTRVVGSPATLRFSTYDVNGAGGYRPAIDDSVAVYENGILIFTGVITEIQETGLTAAETGYDAGVICDCTCADKNALLLRDTYTQTYANGTLLKTVLQDLIAAKLGARGVTLNVSQGDGPPLTGLVFTDAYLDDILNRLQTITGWIWDIDVLGVLTMRAPGAQAWGYTLGDASGDVIGGVSARQSRNSDYANRITVVYGQAQQVNIDDQWTGDGLTSSWTARYPPVSNGNGWILARGLVREDAAGVITEQTLGLSGTAYTYNPTTRVLSRAAGNLPSGTIITFTYAVQFPLSVTVNDAAEQAAHGVYARRYTAEDVWTAGEATAIANGLLANGIALPKIVTVSHRKGPAVPGLTVPLTFAQRGLNATFMIVDVAFVSGPDLRLTWTLGCVAGTKLQATWLDFFKQGSAGGSSSAGSVVGSAVPKVSPQFVDDIVANVGEAEAEVSLNNAYRNSQTLGPAVQLGRLQDPTTWVVQANRKSPSPAIAELMLVAPSFLSGTAKYHAKFHAPPGSTDTVYLVPDGAGGGALNLGGPSSVFGDNAHRVNAYTNILNALNGLVERGRTAAAGVWTAVAYAAGTFTADTGSWTVDSGDQDDLSFELTGLTMDFNFELITTSVTGTPAYLKIAIPGGRTATRRMRQDVYLDDNGTLRDGMAIVFPGEAFVRIYRKDLGVFAASTNLTAVRGKLRFAVDF